MEPTARKKTTKVTRTAARYMTNGQLLQEIEFFTAITAGYEKQILMDMVYHFEQYRPMMHVTRATMNAQFTEITNKLVNLSDGEWQDVTDNALRALDYIFTRWSMTE